MSEKLRNWAGNVTFAAQNAVRPGSVAALQDAVRSAGTVRVLGSGHSFNHIADTTDTLLSLRDLPRKVEIDAEERTVTIDGGATYADVAPLLHNAGFALANVASLPNITVAGAVATATHGSGDTNQNLAAAVRALKLVTGDGELVSLDSSDAGFDGAVVNLGALGAMSELTLDIVPGYEVRQNVFLELPVSAVLTDFDSLMRQAYSVSLFTRWQGSSVDLLWIKSLADTPAPADTILGATAALGQAHPIPGMDGTACTAQMGVPGPWHERLFHFAIGSTASAGAELQSEFFVSRSDAPAAFAALHQVQHRFSEALLISEVRSVAADTLWLSSAYQQETIGFHFTWRPEWERTMSAVKAVEDALAPFSPRPHWAKLFTLPAREVQARFPRMSDFRDLVTRLDPEGKFRNAFIAEKIFG